MKLSMLYEDGRPTAPKKIATRKIVNDKKQVSDTMSSATGKGDWSQQYATTPPSADSKLLKNFRGRGFA